MAVTFAVGAVTGTVLTFEFGLLWPKFMGRWGEAFGDPVRVRGAVLLHRGDLRRDLHLRLAPAEAVAALLDRRAGRDRRHRRQRLGRRRELVDERALRLHAELGRARSSTSTRSGVIFNKAMPLRGRAHGRRRVPRRRVPDRVGLRHGDAPRPQRPLPPARVHHPVHRRRDRHAGPDGGRRLARPLGLQQRADEVRADRARAEDDRATCPRRCSAT